MEWKLLTQQVVMQPRDLQRCASHQCIKLSTQVKAWKPVISVGLSAFKLLVIDVTGR